jgi:tRNA A-37 threonylcarbamoyl transferase component Bud32
MAQTGGPPRGPKDPRRRRPVGEPPPLPRDLHGFTLLWIAVLVLLALVYFWGRQSGVAGRMQRSIDGTFDRVLLDLSASWKGSTAKDLADAGVFWWFLIILRWALVAALLIWKRWRHLAAFAGSAAIVAAVTKWFPTAGEEGAGVPGHPSFVAASLTVTLVGVIYAVAPEGPWRRLAIAWSVALMLGLTAVLSLIREDTPTEILMGFAIGAAIPFMGFRVFAPESAFPVTYRRGRTAHLQIDGRRSVALQTALSEQLGFEALEIEPFGQAGSGGSTPLRIMLADGRHLFAKLYAENHLRADRWYKFGRTILYGALEDERSFNSVRRMVEYEDHMLRYLRDTGVRTAEPFGFAEVTPEREYVLVTSFIDDAVEISETPVDAALMRDAVDTIRSLWNAGVAHRDIKPANVLVRNGEVYVIDVFFCQLRPSPWRQAIDLANMMLLLALRSDTTTVYEATLRRFTPDDIAEAFAATRGITVPTQLRKMVMRDERSLAKEFSQLAPARRRIPVQRWTLRRLALTGALIAVVVIALSTALERLGPSGFGP